MPIRLKRSNIAVSMADAKRTYCYDGTSGKPVDGQFFAQE
jgi:hypothetical protein